MTSSVRSSRSTRRRSGLSWARRENRSARLSRPCKVRVTELSLLPIEAASVRERSPLRLSMVGVAAELLGLTLVAWILTFDRMRGTDAWPGTVLDGLGWFLGIWATGDLRAEVDPPARLPRDVDRVRLVAVALLL